MLIIMYNYKINIQLGERKGEEGVLMKMRWIQSHYSKLTLYPHLLSLLPLFRMMNEWLD